MRIEYSKKFIKEFKKVPACIKEKFKERLRIFIDNQCHPILNNHFLQGEYDGCRSINIGGDWRAIYEELEDGEVAYFMAIGTHSQLYC
jgi:addiction module RelE/StbE family toxin